ncbi:MAG: thioesterase family protein [Bacteroidota bacterium]
MWIETYKGLVFPSHCDFNEHMDVGNYVGRFEEASWHLFALAGIDRSYFDEFNRGMVTVEQKLKYFQEVLPGDCIIVRSKLEEVRNSSVFSLHQMYILGNESPCAECRLSVVHLDRKLRKSAPFPANIRKRLEAFIQT